MPITNQAGFVRVKKNFSCIFVFFVVQNLKTRKARKAVLALVSDWRGGSGEGDASPTKKRRAFKG